MTEMSEERRLSARVVKFGGSSVTGADRIDTIVEVTRDRLMFSRPVLVVSAFAKATATLERAALAAARDGEVPGDFHRLASYHRDAVSEMTASDPTITATVHALLGECEALLGRLAARRACSPEALDHVLSFGERLSSEIVTAALVRRGIRAIRVDAADVIVTDANHGDARADFEATCARIDGGLPAAAAVPVVTGFLGATPAGVRTTLGREGSDYTAAILAVCLQAEGAEIWTDVDGVMTADPRVVPDARPLRELSYEELFDLTSWGAKVVHPKTVQPLRDAGIPLSIRNTTSITDPGTRINAAPTRENVAPLGVTRLDVASLRAPGHGTPTTEEARGQLETLLRDLEGTGRESSVITVVHRRSVKPDYDARTLAELLGHEDISVGGVAEGRDGATLSVGVERDDADLALRTLHRAIFSPVPSGSHRA